MAARLTFAVLSAVVLTGLPGFVSGACLFDSFGDITNPNDPDCKDVQLRYTRNDDVGNNIALGYEVPLPLDSLTAVDGFRSYPSLHAQHQSLDALSAGVQGAIVGQTLAGRDIWAYRVGDPDDLTVDGGLEAAALINGTIHAREWQSPEAVTEIFEQLTEIASDGGFGQYLHENMAVVVLPVLNIDGFLQTQRFPDRVTASELQPRDGRMRRKNMRHPSSGTPVDEDIDETSDNFFGIDLNRNNADGFGQNGGSSNRPVSLVYPGPRPQTEPEIAALLRAADLGPAPRLRMYTDAHSFSQVFFTPIIGHPRRDRITQSLVATMRMVLGGKYRYGPSDAFIGLTSDYFANSLRIPAWTLEIEPLQSSVFGTDHGHSGFILPNSEVARMRDEVTAMILAGLYTQADKPALQAARIRDTDTSEIRYQARWVGSGQTRRLDVDTNRALIPGRSYRLWLGFNKPMRWRDRAGNLSGFGGLAMPGFPEIQLQFTSLPTSSDVSLTDGDAAWRTTAGIDGIIRYSADALETRFTVPTSIPDGVPMVVAVDAADITRSRLDANPATRVDWNDGHWTGYEDEAGNSTDLGGIDCNFVAYVNTDPSASAPALGSGCRTTVALPPMPPDADGGGGGGAVLWLMWVLAFLPYLKSRWS